MSFILFGVDMIQFLPVLVETIAIYAAISLSLNLELGYTGIPNFGKALYVMAGGALGGAFALHFSSWIFGIAVQGPFYQDLNLVPGINSIIGNNIFLSLGLLLLTLVVAGVAGSFIGFLTSYPAIRLREDYLAMLLLGVAEFTQVLLYTYQPIIGGSFGAQMFDPYAWAGQNRYLVATGAAVLLAFFVYLYVERVARSPLGRTLRAVRDNDVAAESLGKDRVAIRRNVLMVASAVSAMAGVLIMFYSGDFVATAYSRIDYTFWPWVIVIIGGMANNIGVLLATGIFWTAFDEIVLTKGALAGLIPFDLNYLVYIVLGSVLILMLLLRPGGLLKEKPSATFRKSRIQALIESTQSATTRANPQKKIEGTGA
ncbi:MAG: branched-chain amino acid ABC transporter permease [Nitrososphaerota archaeon]|nr:branched-chain amino acid ABC transporter permease [Nitrososphaerota archaeon]